MKRSKQVMLSAIFLAAVSAANGQAQEIKKPAEHEKSNDDIYANQGIGALNNQNRNDRDTAHAHHHYYSHGGHHFLGFFHRRQSMQAPRTSGPRTTGIRSNGFGSSFRTSAHS